MTCSLVPLLFDAIHYWTHSSIIQARLVDNSYAFLISGPKFSKHLINFFIFTILFYSRASANDMAAAARGNEPDEKNIMDGGDDWGSHP